MKVGVPVSQDLASYVANSMVSVHLEVGNGLHTVLPVP